MKDDTKLVYAQAVDEKEDETLDRVSAAFKKAAAKNKERDDTTKPVDSSTEK